MSTHQDEQLVIRCLLGDTTPQDLAHLELCPACRREVERCETALTAFRGSVRHWGQHRHEKAVADLPRAQGPVWLPFTQAGWGLAAVALLTILGIGFSLPRHPAPHILPGSSDGDAALLDHVRTDVARRVPSGMEPLLMLGPAFDEHSEHGSETLP